MTPVVPKEAACIVLVRHSTDWELFWARRSEKMPFMGGFHAFPGGRMDAEDFTIPVRNADDPHAAAVIACAVREAFEEAAVLLCRGADRLSHDQRLIARRALMSGDLTFADFIADHGLELDAALLHPAGRWVTPVYVPRRFDTWFFVAELPPDQTPDLWVEEMEAGEWITPEAALAAWHADEVMIAPPALHTISSFRRWTKADAGHNRHWPVLADLIAENPHARGIPSHAVDVRPGVVHFPLRTPTLPPATHTNAWIIGGNDVIVIDPASPFPEEHERLDAYLAERGATVREIRLTHHHPDHIAGVAETRERWGVPIAAHPITADLLHGKITVDRHIHDGDVLDLPGDPGWRVRAILTPGHAPGHLCFYEEISRSLVTGDMIVGAGSVLINPPEGDMRQYLDSLRRLRELPLKLILGGHGPALGDPYRRIDEYIEHRLKREESIFQTLLDGAKTIPDIVKIAYATTPVELHQLAARSTLAHLEKLAADGRVRRDAADRWAVGD